ncbi:DNA replication/repair protein RecF [Actinomyces bowdenii]|uniref:DNA replication and repair protein RecF n=1 Tax=Actinomyces bowdenii TaxID=131109 RepID=A0A3P1V932_9ACTO|nr:DNA replication/repair protein RecF [Actinomyces bowdenii]RRD30167.1 DNA replication/repair protein RecF [Actinomyces bowdenii]
MFVSDLSLDDFRSYHRLVLSLEAGPTAFIGANGQGKTNLVEAIAYLATLSSHRVGADTALVRRAQPGESQPAGAVLRARAAHGQRPTVVEIEIIAGRANRARLNRGSCRPRDLVGVLRTVVFAPEDLALVREEPGLRRRFLDDLAVMMRPGLAAVRAEHDKILAQRASLLKSARASRSSGASMSSMLSTLEVWDAQLASAASRLIAARIEVLSRLRPWVEAAYQEVSQASGDALGAQLAYRSSLLIHEGAPEPDPSGAQSWHRGEEELADAAATATRLETAMGALHTREVDRGANLVGAHRDDLALFLGGLPARGFASHGEQWSLALALRLASYNMLRHDLDAYGGDGEPVLILDDVFASLDQRRRRALATMVSGAQQVLLTAAVDQDVPEELDGARFRVEGGEVTRV